MAVEAVMNTACRETITFTGIGSDTLSRMISFVHALSNADLILMSEDRNHPWVRDKHSADIFASMRNIRLNGTCEADP
jgi:hypothetical protein